MLAHWRECRAQRREHANIHEVMGLGREPRWKRIRLYAFRLRKYRWSELRYMFWGWMPHRFILSDVPSSMFRQCKRCCHTEII